MSLTKSEREVLEVALGRLASMRTVGPHGQGCGLSDEVKEAVRIYLDSWVLPVLAQVLTPPAERNNYTLPDEKWAKGNSLHRLSFQWAMGEFGGKQ